MTSTRALVFACGLLLAALIGVSFGQGQTHKPDSSVEGLVGENAVVFLRGGFPVVEKREIVQLHGSVSAVTDHGMFFKPINRRYKLDRQGDDKKPYTGTCFVPWTSVAYMKLIRQK